MLKYLFFFLSLISVTLSISATYELTDYKKERGLLVKTHEADVFYFNNKVLIQKIMKGNQETIYFSGKEQKPLLYSKTKINTNQLEVINLDSAMNNLKFRNNPLERVIKSTNYLAISLSLLIIIIGLTRLWASNVFFTYVAPFSTYSSTSEIAGKLTFRTLLVPLCMFLFCFLITCFAYKPPLNSTVLITNLILVLVVLIIKWVSINVNCALFQVSKFKQIHIFEFLKWGIVLSILFFISQTILIFNGLELSVVYQIVMFFYVVIWLVRISYVFIKHTKRNFIYFFSYLCATEGVPILLLTVFWN